MIPYIDFTARAPGNNIISPSDRALIADKLRGHPDPDSVVLNSIANGWTGVFPEKASPTPKQKADPQRNDFWRKVASK